MASFKISVKMDITKIEGDVETKFSDYTANYDNLAYESMHGVQSAVVATLVQLGDDSDEAAEK